MTRRPLAIFAALLVGSGVAVTAFIAGMRFGRSNGDHRAKVAEAHAAHVQALSAVRAAAPRRRSVHDQAMRRAQLAHAKWMRLQGATPAQTNAAWETLRLELLAHRQKTPLHASEFFGDYADGFKGKP